MRPYTSTIFAEMSALALRTGAINLGQGFPDTDGPPSLLADAAANITGGVNQYPPGLGVPALRTAVAEHQRRFYGLPVEPDDVLITTGATEAIASAVLGLCEPGDEVVAFEPFYDSYAATIALAGAVLRPVPLRPPTFGFDPDELRAAFSSRTKLVLVNTPHNPTGAVFTAEQLTTIGALAAEFGAVVVTDEVYEHMLYDGRPHVPMAGLPDMAERTLTISSAGKTFSVTGWKVGWMHGPRELVASAKAAKQFLTYVRARRSSPRSPPRWACPTPSTPTWRATSSASATSWPPGCAPPGSRCSPRRARTSSSPTPRRSASPTAPSSAGSCPSSSAWRRCRCRCSASTPTSAARWSGSRSASATRCSPKRSRGWPG